MEQGIRYLILFLPIAILSCGDEVGLSDASQTPFDSNKWKQAHDSEHHLFDLTRRRMINDLTASYLRIGMSRRELEELLGPPEIVRSLGAETELSYRLGSGLDPDTIAVQFLELTFVNGGLRQYEVFEL